MQKTFTAHQERRKSSHTSRKSYSSFYRLLDIIVFTIVYLFVLVVSHVNLNFNSMLLLIVFIVSYNFCAEAVNLYRFSRAHSSFVMLKTIAMVWCLASLLTVTFAFVLPSSVSHSTNSMLVLTLALTLPTLLIFRAAFAQGICYLRLKGYNSRTAIIIGTTHSGYKLANQFEEEKHLGIHFIGFYEDRKSDRVPNNMQYLVNGDVSDALELANSGQVDYVYIALPIIAEERIVDMLYKFANSPAKINLISDPLIDTLINASSQQIGSVKTISLFPTSFQNTRIGLNRRRK
jgi:putative colanic acid biosynthesis UDP-glucose lipid carrier transferase